MILQVSAGIVTREGSMASGGQVFQAVRWEIWGWGMNAGVLTPQEAKPQVH